MCVLESMALVKNKGTWQEAEERLLIAFYADYDVLWNPGHVNHDMQVERAIALAMLCDKLWDELRFDVTIEGIKQKWLDLRNSYTLECKKMGQTKHSGVSGDDTYTPSWIFKELQFLKDVVDPDESEDTIATQCIPPSGTLTTQSTAVDVRPSDITSMPNDAEIVPGGLLEDSSDESREKYLCIPTFGTPESTASSKSWNASLRESSCSDSGSRKRARKNLDLSLTEKMVLLQKANDILQRPPCLTLNSAFGNYVAAVLDRLDVDSQLSAHLDIHKVLSDYQKRHLNRPATTD